MIFKQFTSWLKGKYFRCYFSSSDFAFWKVPALSFTLPTNPIPRNPKNPIRKQIRTLPIGSISAADLRRRRSFGWTKSTPARSLKNMTGKFFYLLAPSLWEIARVTLLLVLRTSLLFTCSLMFRRSYFVHLKNKNCFPVTLKFSLTSFSILFSLNNVI